MKFNRWLTAPLVMAGFALLGVPRDAHAVLAIAFQLSNGVTTIRGYATDNDTTPLGYVIPAGYTMFSDTDGTLGRLALPTLAPAAFGGNYIVEGSVQVRTLGTTPGSSDNILNSSALAITNDTGGMITANVAISSTDYVPPAFEFSSSGSITWENAQGPDGGSGGVNSSITMAWYNDPLNNQGADGPTAAIDTPGTVLDTFTDTAIKAADSGSTDAGGPLLVPDLAPYSMSLGFTLTTYDRDTIAGNRNLRGGRFARVVNRGQTLIKPLAAVPEPGTMVMALTALPLLGGSALRWLRRQRA